VELVQRPDVDTGTTAAYFELSADSRNFINFLVSGSLLQMSRHFWDEQRDVSDL
jgi:hypothetical protein